VSKELKESLVEIAFQLQEQLKFYRELGISDIGGTEMAPVADFKASGQTTGLPGEPATGDRLEPVASVKNFQTGTASEAPAKQATGLPSGLAPQGSISAMPATPPKIPPAIPAKDEKPMAKKHPEPPPQTDLFGEARAEPASASANRLPVLNSFSPDNSLEEIRADIGDCTRCKLHEGRTRIVFGEGHPQARLMFVGEGPGANEDVSGRPFVGEAGKLLDKIIAAIGYKRQEVYIGNVVKCRPPGNRAPERDEVETCEPFLFRQIAVIKPKVIVALGSPAFQCLFRSREPISKARGQLRQWNGIQVMPTFHPAYLLRSPEKKREAWEDMKIVRDYLNSLPG
jgi:uracil-DNA glycosylase